MRYLHEKAGIVMKLVVLSLLLGAQSLSLVHAMDHVSASDTSLCAVCSISAGLDGPAHVTHEFSEIQPVIQPRSEQPVLVNPKVFAAPLTARAPPRCC